MSLVFKTFVIVCTILSVQTTFALDKCQLLKRMQKSIETDKDSLMRLRRIQSEVIAAKEIRSQYLTDHEDVRDIGRLAEVLEEETKKIDEENRMTQTQAAVSVSVGAVILSNFIFKRLAEKPGLSLHNRLAIEIWPKGQRTSVIKKNLLNMTFILTLVADYFLIKEVLANKNKKDALKLVIDKLNTIKDLSQEIITLEDRIEEAEIVFDMKKNDLYSDGLMDIKLQGGKEIIICPES